jgi:import inner membrane translocase subunit TIM21
LQVEGSRNKGVAHVHMTKHPKDDIFEYKYLFVDVRGHDRIYVKKSDEARRADGSKKFKLFGLTLG